MHNRFDQLVKRMSREGLSPGGRVETDAEVSPDAQRIDVWFLPDPARAKAALSPLGLWGRMARSTCAFEAFHVTPSSEQVVGCLVKHRLFCRELSRRKPRPPAPVLWIVSSGRPSAALSELWCRESEQGAGFYDVAPAFRTTLVVVAELPRTRETLLVRLMGAGAVLASAIAELRSLPEDAPERTLALPILVQLRLEIQRKQGKQSKSDREFLMSTRDVEKYLQQLREEGREEGLETGRDKGFAEAVLAAHRARFNAPPPSALVESVERAPDHATLERLLALVTTRSAEEIVRAVTPKRAARRPSRAKKASPRRASGRRAEA